MLEMLRHPGIGDGTAEDATLMAGALSALADLGLTPGNSAAGTSIRIPVYHITHTPSSLIV